MTDKKALEILQNNYDKLIDEFEQYKKESIKWSIEDFTELEDDYTISKEQAQEALEHMISKHDACIGITWDTISYYKELYGKPRIT